MNTKRLLNSSFAAGASAPRPAKEDAQAASRKGLERSRKTILFGWIISMIGIVTYCFVMSSGDQQADLASALAAGGALGWVAVAIIAIGVGLWFAGCVRFLREADFTSADGGGK